VTSSNQANQNQNQNQNQILQGDSLTKLKEMEPDTVDLIVTDPPYALTPGSYNENHKGGFMNKTWDAKLVSVETWKECLRVLKPGAFAFVMSSPRQDVLAKMILNLIEAGFETNFSSIYWTYACLSEDTEVLTQDGWERCHNTNTFKARKILCYNAANDEYHFEVPQEWKIYNKVQDTLFRIRSSHTDQLVTRNHRCIVERDGKLLFEFAENLGQTIRMPYLEAMPMLQKPIHNVSSNDKTKGSWDYGNILFDPLQTKDEYLQISPSEPQIHSWYVRRTQTDTTRQYVGRKEQSLERGSNILQNTWKLCRRKIHPLSERILVYGKERRLRYGTPYTSSKSTWQVVHHIDHNPTNNNLDNLMLFVSNQHHKKYEHFPNLIKPLWQQLAENTIAV
jgi:hypothetical protein